MKTSEKKWASYIWYICRPNPTKRKKKKKQTGAGNGEVNPDKIVSLNI
jgi:hypothetical protein